MKNKKYYYYIIIVAVAAVAFLGTFLPGWLLVWRSREKMNMVDAVPVEYYSPQIWRLPAMLLPIWKSIRSFS